VAGPAQGRNMSEKRSGAGAAFERQLQKTAKGRAALKRLPEVVQRAAVASGLQERVQGFVDDLKLIGLEAPRTIEDLEDAAAFVGMPVDRLLDENWTAKQMLRLATWQVNRRVGEKHFDDLAKKRPKKDRGRPVKKDLNAVASLILERGEHLQMPNWGNLLFKYAVSLPGTTTKNSLRGAVYRARNRSVKQNS